MDRRKSQHYNFCFEAIPALFHSQTSDFYKYLERDGLKFLEFWWNHVGERLSFEQLSPMTDMTYEVIQKDKDTRIVFLTLPHPREEGEAYFMAMISRPEKRFAWVRLPTTRILCLVRRSKDQFAQGTQIGDLTPRAIFVPIGPGCEPTKKAFTDAVMAIIKR